MQKYYLPAILAFLCLSSDAQAVPLETMQHIREICLKTRLTSPSDQDKAASAYCRGYMKAQAEKATFSKNYYFCDNPQTKISIERIIEVFLKVTDKPKKYGYDKPGLVPLMQESPSLQIPLIIASNAFCKAPH